jgi:hypothetical protein
MTANLNVRYDYEPFLDYGNVTIDYPKQYLKYEEELEYYWGHFENDEPIEGLDCKEWAQTKEDQLGMFFYFDYDELDSKGQYFFGCAFDIYKNTYSERYISYLFDFPDANEINFCNYELKKKEEYICSDKLKEKMDYSIKKRNQFLNKKISDTKILINESEVLDLSNTTSTIENTKKTDYTAVNLDFNLNEFNEVTFNLFNYLIGNYDKKGIVKYSNIFKYLKSLNKDVYAFNFTQDKYKEFILKKYQVKLTTFGTANYEYEDKEKPILNGFEQAFRSHNLK